MSLHKLYQNLIDDKTWEYNSIMAKGHGPRSQLGEGQPCVREMSSHPAMNEDRDHHLAHPPLGKGCNPWSTLNEDCNPRPTLGEGCNPL